MQQGQDEYWVPWDLSETDGAPQVRWARVDGHVFGEPFFEDGVRAAGWRFSRKERTRLTSLDALDDWAARPAELPIRGLVFHTSRCGSTLLMQLLRATERVAVVAEPPVVEQLLRLTVPESAWTADRADVKRWCKGAMHALSQRRGQANLDSTVVKLDAWLAGGIHVLGAVVPTAWRTFLFREPAAILASHRHMRGMFMVPYVIPWQALGTDGPCQNPAALDRWAAQVLLAILRAGKAAVERGDVWPLAYHDVVRATCETVLPSLGIALTDDIRARVQESATRNSKRPKEIFSVPSECSLETLSLGAELSEELESVYAELLAFSARSNADSSQRLVSTSTTR
jgi:hypothetical protein